jgi:hypothetical protein
MPEELKNSAPMNAVSIKLKEIAYYFYSPQKAETQLIFKNDMTVISYDEIPLSDSCYGLLREY